MTAAAASVGFVKICGMTDEAAVEAALAAGADAIGFVFAPSVRRVSAERARQLAQPARGKALIVAVTQHPDLALLHEVVEQFQPDVLQTDAGDVVTEQLPQSVAYWPVLRAGSQPANAVKAQRVLFEGPRSGTGKVADWQAAALAAHHYELILAGGLNAANVGDAIRTVRPFGVDVSSGVEHAPGRKSAVQIEQFVKSARAAFAAAQDINQDISQDISQDTSDYSTGA